MKKSIVCVAFFLSLSCSYLPMHGAAVPAAVVNTSEQIAAHVIDRLMNSGIYAKDWVENYKTTIQDYITKQVEQDPKYAQQNIDKIIPDVMAKNFSPTLGSLGQQGLSLGQSLYNSARTWQQRLVAPRVGDKYWYHYPVDAALSPFKWISENPFFTVGIGAGMMAYMQYRAYMYQKAALGLAKDIDLGIKAAGNAKTSQHPNNVIADIEVTEDTLNDLNLIGEQTLAARFKRKKRQ